MHNTLTLKQALDGLEHQDFSIEELYADTDAVVANKNKELNVYLTTNQEALSQAKAATNLPLRGVPIAVKDNFLTKGLRTTASSTVLDTFIPPHESTVTGKLKAAGGVIYGKTNMDAWAHGSSTETSQYGRTLNPRNTAHLPGGSSGGGAAAIAADMCIASLGSETAGSIRLPAAWCGVVGLKPTYGRVSRFGVVAMASSTDSPGPITKTVEDAAIMLNVIAGHDKYDGTTSPQTAPDFTKTLGKTIKDLKIGVMYLDLPGLEQVKPHYEQALSVLEQLGAKVEHVQALDPTYAISVYTIVQRGEVSSNLGRYDGIRFGNDRSFFGDEARRRILLGTFTLSKGYSDQYYTLAQKARTLFMQDYQKLFSQYDVLVAPTTPSFADALGASTQSAMYGELADMLLEPSSLTGLPAVSVPCYHDSATNLFLGLNIMAPMWHEAVSIQVADAFEHATDWNTWRKTNH